MAQPCAEFLAHKFTRENAREMSARGNAARWSRNANSPAIPANGSNLTGNDAESPHARKVARLEAQIEAIDEAMEKAKTPADWRDLTNAKARLFEQWAHLAGIPKPGSRRPGREPVKRAASVPLDPAPAPGPNPTPEPPATPQ